jgi:hypothetical protein
MGKSSKSKTDRKTGKKYLGFLSEDGKHYKGTKGSIKFGIETAKAIQDAQAARAAAAGHTGGRRRTHNKRRFQKLRRTWRR